MNADQPRSLPIRVAIGDGEALDSWLLRLAIRNQIPAQWLLRLLGLGELLRPWNNHALVGGLPPDVLRRIELQAGLAPRALDSAVLDPYRPLGWRPTPGSRFCPDCLRDPQLRWPVRWQLPYTFACLQHGCLLAGYCRVCERAPQSQWSSRTGTVPAWECTIRPRSNAEVCGADLRDHQPHHLDPDDPRIATQQWINDRLDAISTPAADELRDLDALALWFRRRLHPPDLAGFDAITVAGAAEYRLLRRRKAERSMQAYETLVTAAVATQAVQLLNATTTEMLFARADSTGGRNTPISEVCVGRPTGWTTKVTGRPAMRSPGRPPACRREQRQRFWALIAQGVSSEQAALGVGVSQPLGPRWFRKAGGMPDVSSAPLSGRFLSLEEREEIALLRVQKVGVRQIARKLGRSASTISRELRRNAATRGGQLDYRATNAQWHADRRANRPKIAKLAADDRLRTYVQDRLDGKVVRADGKPAAAPDAKAWKGRRHGRRTDRRWATAWSPEQIAGRLRVDFPDDESMRISHEAIYQALYIQGRGALRRELTASLRTGRALRVPRARTKRGKNFVTDEVMISQRPAEAEDRAVPGHWEGDLILGLEGTAIGTLVERTTRFTMLLHLPPMPGHGIGERAKNGPALAGHGAQAVREAITSTITTLPALLRKTLTWDQGAEMAQHAQLRIDTNIDIYFCEPHSPWQRPSNENTNGLLRQYFPKGTDLSRYRREDLEAVAITLNNRPRKTLGWKTPAESLNDQLLSLQTTGVASTG